MSGWASYHPLTTFVYYVGVIVLVMVHLHPVFLATALGGLILIHTVQDRLRELRRWAGPFLMMAGCIVLLNPLISTRGAHILFYFRHNPVTLEGVVYGLTFALSLLCVLVVFVSLNKVMTPNKWMFLFGTFLPRLTLLLMLSVRFVPMLKRRIREIRTVQQMRGVSVTVGSLKQRAKSGMLFLQTLLTWSLEEALTTADSMKARGYGVRKRSAYFPYKMEGRDWAVCAALVTWAVICFVGYVRGYGVLTIYPELGTFGLTATDWGVFAAFLLFISTPFIVEGGVRWQWRYSK